MKLKIEYRKVSELLPYARNARTHSDAQVAQLAASIKEFGFNNPVAIDADGMILCGHGRVMAAQKLHMAEVPTVCLSHLSDTQVKAYILADNKLALNAGWDNDMLKVELEDLKDSDFDLNLTGFSDDELKDILVEDPTEVQEDNFDGEPPEVAKSQLGDIWTLGEHRLMCGDSTSENDVKTLMQDEKADISFTSPPYNAGLTPTEMKMNKTSKYLNDNDNKNQDEYFDFLSNFTKNSLSNSEYCFVNIQMLSNNKIAFCEYLNEYKKELVDIIIWDKLTSQPAMAENVLNSEFEFVLCFGGNGPRSIGTKKFRGTLKNIVHISKQSKNKIKEHNATFPVEFASYFIDSFCNKGEVVLDLFGGSGTTLIACEQLGRKARLMELDEHYVDVIVNRWQDLTGKEAIRQDGIKFNDL